MKDKHECSDGKPKHRCQFSLSWSRMNVMAATASCKNIIVTGCTSFNCVFLQAPCQGESQGQSVLCRLINPLTMSYDSLGALRNCMFFYKVTETKIIIFSRHIQEMKTLLVKRHKLTLFSLSQAIKSSVLIFEHFECVSLMD